MILNLLAILMVLSILLFSYLISNFLSSKIKLKIIKKLYVNSVKFESKNFLFKLFIQSISPFIFIIVSALFSFSVPNFLHHLNNPEIEKIPFLIAVSTVSLSVKIGLIWFIYRIATISSLNRIINQIFASALLIISLANFFGLSDYVITFLGKFKTNFGDFEISVYRALFFLLIFFGVFWFNKIILEATKKILDTTQINTNTKILFIKFLSILLIAIAIIVSLYWIGFDIKSLTIFGSALVVGLGFGFQKLVSNILSGITISFEEIIKEGDIITIDDKREIKGIVKNLNMRYVLVSEFDGKDVMIPNDTILTSNVANLTHSRNVMRIRIDLMLPYDVNIKEFREEIVRIMNANPHASNLEESAFHIEGLTETGLKTFLFFWIEDPFNVNIARTSIIFEILNYLKVKQIKIPEPITKIIHKPDF